jgi:opacity protein-like surface antigen
VFAETSESELAQKELELEKQKLELERQKLELQMAQQREMEKQKQEALKLKNELELQKQKAELEKQNSYSEKELELEKQKLELERQKLELQRQQNSNLNTPKQPQVDTSEQQKTQMELEKARIQLEIEREKNRKKIEVAPKTEYKPSKPKKTAYIGYSYGIGESHYEVTYGGYQFEDYNSLDYRDAFEVGFQGFTLGFIFKNLLMEFVYNKYEIIDPKYGTDSVTGLGLNYIIKFSDSIITPAIILGIESISNDFASFDYQIEENSGFGFTAGLGLMINIGDVLDLTIAYKWKQHMYLFDREYQECSSSYYYGESCYTSTTTADYKDVMGITTFSTSIKF